MNLKTYQDSRTFEEKTGLNYKELLTALKGDKTGDNSTDQKDIKPEPDHHFFDVLQEFPKINHIQEFVRKLFCLYFLHKTLPFPPADMEEIAWGFSVEQFCKHHEVEKRDFDKIASESYTLLEIEKREWQVDKFRDEVLKQVELYLKSKENIKELPPMQELFRNIDYFNTVISRLKTEGHISLDRKTGKWHWRGSVNLMGGLAFKLEKHHRLHSDTLTKQDIGRIFCRYFNRKWNEKAFQPGQSQTQAHHFNWITDF